MNSLKTAGSVCEQAYVISKQNKHLLDNFSPKHSSRLWDVLVKTPASCQTLEGVSSGC